MSLESLVSGGPSTETFDAQPDSPFIGVDEDYRAPNPRFQQAKSQGRSGAPFTQYVPPRYTKSSLNATMADTPPEDVWRMQQALSKAGFIGPKTKFAVGQWDDTTVAAYRKLLTFANRSGVDEVSALERYAAARDLGMLDDEDGEDAPFTGTKSQTSKRVDVSDPTTARKMARDVFRQKLGRAPKRGEYESFVAALNAAEQRNATVSQSSTSYVEGEATGTSTTSTGGLDAAGFAEEYAQQGEVGTEANTFRVATDYYDAAMQALRSPV